MRATEKVICARVQLTDATQLHRVRALSLPGGESNKFSTLGRALRHFTRLQSLDLSNNALTSLEGLEHLALLTHLNVYFNRISAVEELLRLRKNGALEVVDLRLNQVVTAFPDCRFLLLSLLPRLREINGVEVQATERAAALRWAAQQEHRESPAAVAPQPQPPHQQPQQQPQQQPKPRRVSLGARALDDLSSDMLDALLADAPLHPPQPPPPQPPPSPVVSPRATLPLAGQCDPTQLVGATVTKLDSLLRHHVGVELASAANLGFEFQGKVRELLDADVVRPLQQHFGALLSQAQRNHEAERGNVGDLQSQLAAVQHDNDLLRQRLAQLANGTPHDATEVQLLLADNRRKDEALALAHGRQHELERVIARLQENEAAASRELQHLQSLVARVQNQARAHTAQQEQTTQAAAALAADNERLRAQTLKASEMHGLVKMLQQSHHALSQSNDRLLAQLERERAACSCRPLNGTTR